MRALKYQNSNGETVNSYAEAEANAKVVLEPIAEETVKPTKEQYEKITERIVNKKVGKVGLV